MLPVSSAPVTSGGWKAREPCAGNATNSQSAACGDGMLDTGSKRACASTISDIGTLI
jgi:hypothetical protein